MLCLIVSTTASAGPHDSFLLGPWEILARVGLEGETLHFPLAVEDRDQAQTLTQHFPVEGGPMVVRMRQYVPDLTWETRAIPEAGGGCSVKVMVEGEGLNQQWWLASRDFDRMAISSRIGGIAIRELRDPSRAARNAKALSTLRVFGVIAVGDGESTPIQEYTVHKQSTVSLTGDLGSLAVVDYLPHYAMNTETKKVFTRSEEPTNPAVLLRLEQKGKTWERWFWSRFSASPHEQTSSPFPVPIRFAHYDLGKKARDTSILIVAKGTDSWLLSQQGNKRKIQTLKRNQPYPFSDKRYQFKITDVTHGSVVRRVWQNNKNQLLRPAVVCTITTRGTEKEVVLEFNKPHHFKTQDGTLVLLFRRQAPSGY